MERVAAEWARQEETVDPADMPITRLLNSAIDGVSRTMDETRGDIARYAGSDLLCYRAAAPETLAERQRRAFDPVLAWAAEALGARFNLAAGVIYVAQPREALDAVRAALDAVDDPAALAALSVITSLTGSALIALAVFGSLIPDFFSLVSLSDLGRQVAEFGLIVLGLSIVLMSGGIDLSVGSVMGLAAIAAGLVLQDAGPWWLAVSAGLLTGFVVGAVNGDRDQLAGGGVRQDEARIFTWDPGIEHHLIGFAELGHEFVKARRCFGQRCDLLRFNEGELRVFKGEIALALLVELQVPVAHELMCRGARQPRHPEYVDVVFEGRMMPRRAHAIDGFQHIVWLGVPTLDDSVRRVGRVARPGRSRRHRRGRGGLLQECDADGYFRHSGTRFALRSRLSASL